MNDLTEAELALIEKDGGRRVRHHQVRQLVAEVRRRRAEAAPVGVKHELVLEEKVGTEER